MLNEDLNFCGTILFVCVWERKKRKSEAEICELAKFGRRERWGRRPAGTAAVAFLFIVSDFG